MTKFDVIHYFKLECEVNFSFLSSNNQKIPSTLPS